jgi:hypothetical protein
MIGARWRWGAGSATITSTQRDTEGAGNTTSGFRSTQNDITSIESRALVWNVGVLLSFKTSILSPEFEHTDNATVPHSNLPERSSGSSCMSPADAYTPCSSCGYVKPHIDRAASSLSIIVNVSFQEHTAFSCLPARISSATASAS